MKYKPGDKVRIKSLDWYKANECSGRVMCDGIAFQGMMTEWCGKELTIDLVYTNDEGRSLYIMKEPETQWRFTDSMIEDLVEEVPQEKMVSLEKVVKYLQSKLKYSPNIDGLQIYDTSIEGFVNDLRKTLEE